MNTWDNFGTYISDSIRRQGLSVTEREMIRRWLSFVTMSEFPHLDLSVNWPSVLLTHRSETGNTSIEFRPGENPFLYRRTLGRDSGEGKEFESILRALEEFKRWIGRNGHAVGPKFGCIHHEPKEDK